MDFSSFIGKAGGSGSGSKGATKATNELTAALEAQKKIIADIDMDEVRYFEKEFLPAYYLTLDEHTKR